MSFEREKPKFGASNPALNTIHDSSRGEVVSWIVGLVVAVLCLYWAVGLATDFLARKISDEQEAKWFAGDRVLGLTGFKSTSGAEDPDFLRCQSLLTQLKSDKSLRRLPYNLYYSNSTTPNAFAAPGGSLMVTQGLLDLVKSDMGLAMVLGHELGHLQYRDPLRGMGRNILMSLILAVFVGGDASAAQLIVGLVENSYSRDQELRADQFGFKLLFSTFHRTAGALEFFEKMSEHQSSQMHALASMLSTHPFTPDRIDALRSLEATLRNSQDSQHQK